ncbi:MAG: family 78 glycoside hydrolase catalytic domain [Verrucomicrobia bacterium]|nr:family 78 glycoside hydrolase catalytic domain [Cytophagales bacterium]
MAVSGQNFIAIRLRCEGRDNPLGIDERTPRFSWVMNDSRREAIQSAYQVLVASSPDKLQNNQGDMWDSGKKNTDESLEVEYSGLALQSCKKYFWKVKIWDKLGKPAAWSENGNFEMGFLSVTEWKADWIGRKEIISYPKLPDGKWIWHPQPANPGNTVYFRKNFQIPADKFIVTATLKATADNRFEAFVNQVRVINNRDLPADKGFRFNICDISRNLKIGGENLLTIAAMQTNLNEQGGFIGVLRIEFSDNTFLEIASDDTWQTNTTERPGWVSEMPIARWTKPKVIESYGGRKWGSIQNPYVAPRSQLLRKEFVVRKKIAQARIYASGLGAYYLYLNGKKVGKDWFAPGFTNYNKHIQYQIYDVTTQLITGNNAVGAMLGNMWWSGEMMYRGMGNFSEGPLRFIMQLRIDYEDGSSEIVFTDKTWKIKPSPVVFNSLYDGERYDATQETENWNKIGTEDTKWLPVEVIQESKTKLISEKVQPIESTILQAVSVTEIARERFIINFGQNLVGVVRMSVQGKAGTRITLRFSELINPDGSLRTEPLKTSKSTDEYILSGKGVEIYEPRFTYHGFQYVEVVGYPGKLTKEMIVAQVLTSKLSPREQAQRGQFTCYLESEPQPGTRTDEHLINKIQKSIDWTLQGNIMGLITDSPQRDERITRMIDLQHVATTALYNRYANQLLNKSVMDIVDGQKEDGDLLSFNPNPHNKDNPAPAGWGEAIVLVPWQLYQFSGEKRVLEKNYPYMVKWHQKKQLESKGILREGGNTNDISALVPTPPELISNAYFCYATQLLAQIARVLKKEDDYKKYAEQAEKIAKAFNEKYFDKLTNNYLSGTQTANALPLAFGITPVEFQENVARNIANDVRKQDNHLTTGLIGTPHLLPVLSKYGFHDVAYLLAVQWTYPSWGYMVDEKKSNTIWEAWNADQQSAETYIRSHVGLVSVGEWFFKYLSGIRTDMVQTGFKKIIVEPRPVGNLNLITSRLETSYGVIASICKRTERGLEISVEIPPNTTALIILPVKSAANIKEGKLPLAKAPGIKSVKEEKGSVFLETGSGKYVFIIPN